MALIHFRFSLFWRIYFQRHQPRIKYKITQNCIYSIISSSEILDVEISIFAYDEYKRESESKIESNVISINFLYLSININTSIIVS